MAASPSIVPRQRQQQSGSTPRDAVIADPKLHRHIPFWPSPARQHLRLRRSAILARDSPGNLVDQPAIRSFAPARTPQLRPKTTGSTGSESASPTLTSAPNPHSARCTVGAQHPAISCLGAFRTPAVRAREGLGIPASENPHTSSHPPVGHKLIPMPRRHFSRSTKGSLHGDLAK